MEITTINNTEIGYSIFHPEIAFWAMIHRNGINLYNGLWKARITSSQGKPLAEPSIETCSTTLRPYPLLDICTDEQVSACEEEKAQ